MASQRQITFLINANTNAFTKGLNSAQARLKKFGRSMTRTGRAMSRNITAPLVAAGAASVKFASDFQTSLAQASAQADLTTSQVNKIGDAAEKTAMRTGEATGDIIEAYKFTVSAGLSVAESQELVGAAAEASASGFGEQRDLVRLATTAMQAYSDELQSGRQFMDLLVGSAQQMEIEVGKLGPAMQRNVGVANELGVGLEELLAGIGSVSEIMGDAQRGGRLFQSMLTKLLNPTEGARDAIEQVFGSVSKMHQAIAQDGLLNTMNTLRSRLEQTHEAGLGVVFSQRSLEAALNFTNNEGQRTNEIMSNIGDTTGATVGAFEKSADFARDLSRAYETLKATMRPVGNILIDTLQPMLQSVRRSMQGMANTLKEMNPATLQAGIKYAALAAAIGPVIWGMGQMTIATGALIGGFKTLIGVLITLGKGVLAGVVTGSVTKFTAALRLARIKGIIPLTKAIAARLGIFFSIIAVFGLVVAAGQNLIDNWELVGLKLKKTWKQLKIDVFDLARATTKAIAKMSLNDAVKVQMNAASAFFETKLTEMGWEFGRLEQRINDMETVGFQQSVENATMKFKEMFSGLMPNFSFSDLLPDFDFAGSGLGGGGKGGSNKNPLGFATPPNITQETENWKANIRSMAPAVKKAGSITEIALQGTQSSWDNFVEKSKAAGFDFVNFLSNNVANAISSFAENLGKMFVGAGDEFKTGLQQVLLVVVDFAKQLAQLLIGIGTALEFIPGFGQVAGTPYIIAGTALMALASGAGAAIQKNISKKRQSAQNSGAQGMASGGIVPQGFPNDTYPAMLSSGETVVPSPKDLPSGMGSQNINLSGEFRIKGTDLVMTLEQAQQTLR